MGSVKREMRGMGAEEIGSEKQGERRKKVCPYETN